MPLRIPPEENAKQKRNLKSLAMMANSELSALLNLIEDPDEDVFNSITERFVGMGKEIIPILEEHQHGTHDEELIKKINYIIDLVSLSVLTNELMEWKYSEDQSTIEAALIISNYLNKEFNQENIFFEIEKIRRSIWLELNDYLTPLEEVNIINKIVFGHYKFKGLETNYAKPNDFDLKGLITEKQANTFPIAALYLLISEMLGLGLKPVDVPRQNLLCYYEEEPLFDEQGSSILFFIDPLNGQIYTHKDIENYLKKINYVPHPLQIPAVSNVRFVQKWLNELSKIEKETEQDHKYNGIKALIEKLDDLQ
ncbi:MAG: transglutaminase family protein [Bacteroidota bacterium]|jgi:regulator of sirC expression with transglutaminase-like and TPR domain